MAIIATYIKNYDELTIVDNFLFQKVMRNKRICKMLIEKILKIRVKDIKYPEAEKTIDINYDSKGVRLDVYVEDDKGTIYDIEMQCTSSQPGELPKRTRYYQAMIDMDVLEKGADYNELKKTFIIFICTFDLFGRGLPIYTFSNQCEELPDLHLDDEATKVFLNSKFIESPDDPDIAAFLRYVDGHAAEGDFTTEVDQEAQAIKSHDETRREYMTFKMEIERQRRDAASEATKQEREKGITNLIMTLRELAIDKTTAVNQVMSKYNMSLNDATACVNAHW